jgi:hypothetical protein
MIYTIASIITTLALIWLASHDFHPKAKKTKKRTMKRIQPRDRKGQWAKLPLEIIYAVPQFRYIDERTMVRV